jgi:hypothetical protein
MFAALGLPAATEFRDKLGRPLQLATGQGIEPLYSGA